MNARLADLFALRFGAAPCGTVPLEAHGSDRKLFRLKGRDGRTAIGVENGDLDENAAFTGFARHFRAAGLPVPEIYAEDSAAGVYLEEDLGDTTLFELLQKERGSSGDIPATVAAVYKQSVRLLARMQIEAGKGLDYGLCHPHGAFDRRSMRWDLNYFKYYFLKLAHVPFHEQRLENDFDALCDFLLKAPADFFLYRDFQSRNIMVRGGQPWFIDFQGGRHGALPYDLASLLLDAKADLPFDFRDRLKAQYLEAAAASLSEVAPQQGRGARKRLRLDPERADSEILLIDESYNANPASMRAAIEILGAAKLSGQGRRIAVLGDMLELGPTGPDLHVELAGVLEQNRVDLLFGAGPLTRHLFDALPPHKAGAWAVDAASLEPLVAEALRPGDVVMVKGSNGSRMHALVAELKARLKSGKSESGRTEVC